MIAAELPRTPWLPRLAPVLLLALVVTGLVWLRGGPFQFFLQLDPQNAEGVCFDGERPKLLCDFANVYYAQGLHLHGGFEAVRGFYYSPFFAILMWLLAFLPLALARVFWGLTVFAAGAVLVSLPRRLRLFEGRRATVGYVLVLGTSLPLLHDWYYGQVSSILCALIGLSYAAQQRERRVLSAMLLGLATAIKFYPALFALYYLARRDFRTALYFALTVVVSVGLVPWLVLGAHGYLLFASSLAGNFAHLQHYLASTPYSNAALTVFAHVGRRVFGLDALAPSFALMLSIGVAGVQLAFMARAARRGDARSALLLGFSALPFIVRSCWVHYFVFLPLLQTCLLLASRARGASASLRWSGLVGVAISSTLLSYPYFIVLGEADAYYRSSFPFWATIAILPGLWLSQFSERPLLTENPDLIEIAVE